MNKAAHGALIALVALLPGSAKAESRGGGLAGYVEDTRGTPVAGAIVSLFGKGVGRGGLVTLTDSAGRFFVASLPAGSYTLRALGEGHLPALARQITVLPDRDSMFTLSLAPLDGASAAATSDDESADRPANELRWLLRHKQRSVLENRTGAEHEQRSAPAEASWLPGVDGTLEVMASPVGAAVGPDPTGLQSVPSNVGAVRLGGRFGRGGSWNLGGLLAESESATWRMAGEFVIEPGGGHQLQIGTGYGTRATRPQATIDADGRADNQSVGALFVQDHWQVGKQVALSLGGRFSYIGFVDDRNHLDPIAQIELKPDTNTRMTATVSQHTQVPGGDLLTLSTLAAAPALAYAILDAGLRPERATRYEMAIDQHLGATTVRAHTFYETVDDQLINAFEGPPEARSLRIFNRHGSASRGMGVTLTRRLGDVVSGSVAYTYGHASRALLPGLALAQQERTGFHDVVTRIETNIEGTDTHFVAYYRLCRVAAEGDERTLGSRSGEFQGRFELQLSQGLPFMTGLTRADWDVLVAVRNLFYEPGEGAMLDEMAVMNPPKRLLGGISVRF